MNGKVHGLLYYISFNYKEDMYTSDLIKESIFLTGNAACICSKCERIKE